MFTKRFSLLSRNSLSAVCVVLAVSAVPAGFARADDEPTLFVESAVEHPDNTVTLPLYLGVSDGRPVWFVILDASDGKDAARLGVDQASKLANARDTGAVQHVTMADGVVEFTATVDFTPERIVTPGPGGFPPQQPTAPGAVGEAGYSPLVQMPDGRVLNAPHVANDSGIADKVVAIDFDGRTVRILETDGFSGGKAVRYVSTDASDPVVAALEGVTYAPALAAAPSAGADGTDSARASLAAFVNGQTGDANDQRQGLNSALIDGLDPLNVLSWNPSQGRYSPLWDVFPAAWSPAAVAAGENLRQSDFGDVRNLAQKRIVTAPDGTPFAAANIVVNCPIISMD